MLRQYIWVLAMTITLYAVGIAAAVVNSTDDGESEPLLEIEAIHRLM
jgi:hypothetical protein